MLAQEPVNVNWACAADCIPETVKSRKAKVYGSAQMNITQSEFGKLKIERS